MRIHRGLLPSNLADIVLAFAFVWTGFATAAPSGLENEKCLTCHEAGKKAIQVSDGEGKKRTLPAHDPAKFAKGVHGKLDCVGCHANITDAKENHDHSKAPEGKPSCVTCHEELHAKAKTEGKLADKPRLGVVVDNIAAYKKSLHAGDDSNRPGMPKADCEDCHNSHEFAVPAKGTPEAKQFRLGIAEGCGKCHDEQIETWTESVHGQKVAGDGDPKAAVCTDCHTAHAVLNTSSVTFKTVVTKDCGECHEQQFETYRDTMHGQVNALGWGNTAKCYDCHGSHDIVKVAEKGSKVHPDRRLKTCESCHNGKKAGPAAAGFVSFEPHGHGGDFNKYPAIWIATKGMIGLLIGTFAFFWTHLLLWLYREWKERKAGVPHPRVDVAALGIPPGKHVRRFGPWIRIGHLFFAISLMMLTLTGMPLMYAESSWAPLVIKLLGGPAIAQLIHRIFATSFAAIFIIHVLWLVGYLLRNWKTFKIFGSNSLVPGLQDLFDVIAMFKWFLGQGPRPIFDRWTYWEKFDYWAPFWGVTIIGSSGFMMWFPHITAQYLPGWVFNVAMIAHGEEAFLAAVFLFTVHFFNSHFRPDKFPLDIVMFTGTLSVEHFAKEHTVQYRRLVESGELHKYLVDAPSPGLTLRSKILGFVLIAFGLSLLGLVITGFFQTL